MTQNELALAMGVTQQRLQHIQQAPTLEEARNRLMALKVEVKAAFKRLAFRFHPDRNPGNLEAEGNFKRSGEVLTAIEKLEVKAPQPQVRVVAVHFHRAGSNTNVYGNAYASTTQTQTSPYAARQVAFIRPV